jgi:hypothetical protein
MRLDKGKPSRANKQEGTGVPSKINASKMKEDQRLTEEYTDDDEKLADHVKTSKQNRNTQKLHPTNAGGYKNR